MMKTSSQMLLWHLQPASNIIGKINSCLSDLLLFFIKAKLHHIFTLRACNNQTWGMTPISRRRGPRMKPPPEPSRPPTVPPKIPQNAQNAICIGVHSIEAPQMYCVLFLCSVYNFTASYPKTPRAIGN